MTDDLDKAIAHRLRYYGQMRERMKAHQTKAESISLRKKWLDSQKRANYQNEYDRIRGLLSQSVVAHAPRLKAREAELKGLGIKGPRLFDD